jgi:hypothetical protein
MEWAPPLEKVRAEMERLSPGKSKRSDLKLQLVITVYKMRGECATKKRREALYAA